MMTMVRIPELLKISSSANSVINYNNAIDDYIPFDHENKFYKHEAKIVLEKIRFGLVSLFNGISTLFRLFNAKAILLEEQ